MPNVMGGYLEKGAKAVIDMQDELRSQALKMFSGFPYSAGNGSGAQAREARAEAEGRARKQRPQKK